MGLLTTAIFDDLSGYFFGKFRDKASNITGWAKKTGQDNFLQLLCLLLANFHNFWHIYTTGNLQPEDI